MVRRAVAGEVFVAEYGGEITGFVTVLARMPFQELDDPPGNYALITDLVVLKRFRRLGFGVALLNAAERYAGEQDASELRISLLSANKPARELYMRSGFRSHQEILSKRFDRNKTRA